MAVAAIHRPGALTPSVVLSLGLGLTALVALTLVETNMRAELREAQPGVTPSFFFLDVRGPTPARSSISSSARRRASKSARRR